MFSKDIKLVQREDMRWELTIFPTEGTGTILVLTSQELENILSMYRTFKK